MTFTDLLKRIEDLHNRKNANYATAEDPLANLRECSRLGISPFMGVLVRMQDKWGRIINLSRGTPDMVGESIVDTLMDLAVYALLAILLYEEGDK